MKSPAMKQHDPNDDPFAALSTEFDSNMLTLPTEYGSGAVDPTKEEQQNEEEATETAQSNMTPPSSPKKEEQEVLSPEPKDDENTG